MASPVAPAPVADVAVPFSQSDGIARMSEAVADISSAPPAQEAAPEVPAEQARVEPPSTQQPSPAPTTEPTQAVRDLIAKHGSLEAAAEWAWNTNNRASEMAKVLKANGIDPQTLQPIAQAPEPAPPVEAPVHVDEKLIVDEVRQALARNTEAVSLAQSFQQNETRLGQINTSLIDVQKSIERESIRLQIPEIANDSFRASEVREALRELKAQQFELKAEKRDIAQDQSSLQQRHRQIADFYRGDVHKFYSERETKRQDGIRYEQATKFHEQQFAQAWPTAIEQAIKDHNITPELADDFKRYAKESARAIVNGDGEAAFIEDVPSFVAGKGKEFISLLDKYHRAKAGQYGKMATDRAAVPGPTGSAAVAPPTPTPVPDTLPQLASSALSRLRESARALGIGG